MQVLRSALQLIYPDQCVVCDALVEGRGALCADCWRQTPFLTGHVCDACGAALPGQGDGAADHCDDCIAMPRPWSQGRAAFEYRDTGRRIVLGLKHGDRLDLVPPAARWMAVAGRAVLTPDTVLVPVPAHWRRRVSRRYNQAAELARAISRRTGNEVFPQALTRTRATTKQDGMSVEARFANLTKAIAPSERGGFPKGAVVCLVDDVMTSGATLAAATDACLDAGAARISVLVLARVAKAP